MKYLYLCILVTEILYTRHLQSEPTRFKRPIEALKIVEKFLPKNPRIIDAGAYDGKETVAMSAFWPHATLHAFEPIPENFQNLTKNTQQNPSIYRYEVALSDTIGTARMYVSTEIGSPSTPSQSSSLLAPYEHLNYSNTLFPYETVVKTTTLDAWAAEHAIDKIDFLWLDMQGSELSVLKASPKLLKTVTAILTEVEFVEAYTGQPLYQEIKTWLEQQGFELIATNFDPIKPGYWFGDALFVRKGN